MQHAYAVVVAYEPTVFFELAYALLPAEYDVECKEAQHTPPCTVVKTIKSCLDVTRHRCSAFGRVLATSGLPTQALAVLHQGTRALC